MAFYVVYIEEAHPTDGWQMPSNVEQHVLVASAHTFGERDAAADTCVVKLGLKIPALVDDMQDSTERAYTGWPDRLYVIDRTGGVAFKSKARPFGFDPKEMAKAIASVAGPALKGSRKAVFGRPPRLTPPARRCPASENGGEETRKSPRRE